MLDKRGIQIISYLDELFIIRNDYTTCQKCLARHISLVRKLGFRVNLSKMKGPSPDIDVLGININSVVLSQWLLYRKQLEFIDLLGSFSKRKRATYQQLQSLAGKLGWACHVIRGDRICMCRVLHGMNFLCSLSDKHKLNGVFHADLRRWLSSMKHFNGKACCPSSPITNMHVDVCKQAEGMFCEGNWHYVNWERDWPEAKHIHINYKETIAAVAAALKWAPLWSNFNSIGLTQYPDLIQHRVYIQF